MQWSRPLPSFRRKKPSGVRSPVMNWPVAFVDVAGDELGAFGVGARDEDRRNAADVGGEPRRVEVADRRLGRDQHLAAEVTALLLARQLVLEVNAGGARLDIGLHDLEAVERAAEAGLGVGEDRREPVALGAAFEMLDLVGAGERLVDLARELGARIGRVERLVGVHRAADVRIRRDLPAGKIDRLQPGADHLHRLVAAEGAERPHRLVLLQQLPQPERAALGERVLDRDRPAKLQHVVDAVGPLDAFEPPSGAATTIPKSAMKRVPVEIEQVQGNPSRR